MSERAGAGRFPGGAGSAAAAAVGLALFYWAFRDVRLAELLGSLRELRPGWLPLLAAVPVLDLWIRAVRWRILLAPIAEGPVGSLLQLEAIGLAVNNVLFLRLGELVRGLVAGAELKAPAVSVLATIFVERLCDLAALLGLFAASALLLPGAVPPSLCLWAAVAAAGAVGALALFAAGGPRLRTSAIAARLARLPRAARLLDDAVRGAEGLREPAAAARVAALSVGLWLADAGLYWAGARALGFEPPLGYLRSVVVLATAAAAGALPAVPGAWGNFEAAVRLALESFGYAKALALSYGAFVHLVMYAVVTSLGLVFFYRLGHTFSGVRDMLAKRG